MTIPATTRLSLAALSAAIAIAAAPVGASAAEVAVYRGAKGGEPVQNGVDTRFGVTEIRGSRTAVTSETGGPVSLAAADTPRLVAAGSRLWLYDPETKKVTVCRLRSFGLIGSTTVVCRTNGVVM